MDLDTVRDWIDAYVGIKTDEASLKLRKKKRDELEQQVLLFFEQEGITSIRVGDHTVSLRRDVRASVKAGCQEAACDALRILDRADVVKETVHAGTLSSIVREYDEADEEVPALLADQINVAEMFSVRATKR